MLVPSSIMLQMLKRVETYLSATPCTERSQLGRIRSPGCTASGTAASPCVPTGRPRSVHLQLQTFCYYNYN